MCRIAGFISKHISAQEREHVLHDMVIAMRRGGPDGNGIFTENQMTLGHARLSIIDLSAAGAQPMQDVQKKCCIVFNGEIYNYKTLKAKLVGLGYMFANETDTEVILNAYLAWGVDSFHILEGMFSFVLYDKQRQEVYMVRGKNGIKPLYYYLDDDTLIFASEVRAFGKLHDKPAVNPHWKTLFLAYGYMPEPETTYKNIKSLPKAHYLKYHLYDHKYDLVPYFKYTFDTKITNYADAKRLIKETLTQTVKSHLISDAPIGIFLSGGLDSSVISLIGDEVHNHRLNTMSAIFEDEEYTEREYQEEVLSCINSQHLFYSVSKGDLLSNTNDIMEAMDQPSTDGINSYFISKCAAEIGIKAVLSGLGADELFGGYPSFRPQFLVSKFSNVSSFLAENLSSFIDEKFRKVVLLKMKKELGHYLMYRTCFSPLSIAQILQADEVEIENFLYQHYANISTINSTTFNNMSYLEMNNYMLCQLLRDTDYMSMWHGIELRVPFLDTNFVNIMNSLSAHLKMYGENPKQLLIDSFSDILPKKIQSRQKKGFIFPFKKWMKDMEIVNQMLYHNNKKIKNLSLQYHADNLHWSRMWALTLHDNWEKYH
ncbi:MAG: asparagine synthase (glutamine-hydrolyzing) [Cytophagales bacterium]|nr:asparagine synthase (glutamine-hydrolyzing) [Cytophagales bacterium]